jgi:hypothetical protein
VTPAETAPVTTVETTVAETTPVETTPVETEPVTTPVETEPVTTPVETTPVVTEITTEVTTLAEINVKIPDEKFDDIIKNVRDQVFPEDYKPEFYYEHEKEFNKIADDFAATVKFEADVQGADGKTTSTEFSFKLTKDDVILPKAEDLNPGTVYDGTKFKYEVPVKIAIDNIKPEGITGADGKAVDAELAQKFIDECKAKDFTANMPVMIGLLGDFDLSHSVVQTDATFILREQLATQVEGKSIIEDTILADKEDAKKELGQYTVDFAKFLGDTDMDGEGKQVDATFILRAILARDFSETTDKTRISEEIWKDLGVIK